MADIQERIGQSIGDYRLQCLLGKGTFGTVYLAEHLHDHTSAAVKVLHFPLTDRNTWQAFLNEARTIRLQHPHIVPILDFDLSRRDDLPYLVMAYAEGGTLRERHPRGSKLSHETIDTYVQQLASALQYAHDHRIVHRDVKPENMLVRSDGTIQLSDFGIARISEHTNLVTQHQTAGTPAYAAPEQTQGKPCPASDQYALAVVVYEWLTGQLPFQGELFAVMAQHRMDAPPSLSSICPDVSPRVEQVVLTALAKSPQDRFPTITHFAQTLHTALQDTVPTQPLSKEDTSPYATFPIAPTPLPDASPPQMVPLGVSFASAETSFSPQITYTPPSGLYTSDAEKTAICLSPHLPLILQKKAITSHLPRTLLILLCLVLLLGGGGTTWLVVTQQQQERATHSATATAVSHSSTATAVAVPLATATAAANTYWTEVANKGVQFGFDAAHTHSNPYERVLNTANVAHMTQLWSFTTGAAIFSSPAVAGGMVYLGSGDQNLYAFDATCHSSCQPLWSFTTEGSITSSPAVAGGMVYVGSFAYDGKFYAFDATCRSGCQPLWYFQPGSFFFSSPVVANGMVYVGSGDGKLYAFDATCRHDCQPLWSFTTSDRIDSSPAVANGMVYLASDDHTLYTFDAACRHACQPLWSFTTGDWIGSSPTVANGMVYVGSYDRKLYAFDAACRRSCQPLWSFTAGNAIGSSPAVANGMVYVGSDDHKLYTFDATCRHACKPLWSFTTANHVNSSPTVANGVVYVGSIDGKFHAFDATCRRACQPLWSFAARGGIESSPAVVNGVVYVASDDYNLYAFGLPTSS